MADIHSSEIRSYNMSRIKGKNTKPEMSIRKVLFSKGFRYRINVKNLPGSPDIVLKKYRVVIFVNGCFWHGNDDCKYYVIPKTRTDWWLSKDQKHIRSLEDEEWNVIVIWECKLKKEKIDHTLSALIDKIHTFSL